MTNETPSQATPDAVAAYAQINELMERVRAIANGVSPRKDEDGDDLLQITVIAAVALDHGERSQIGLLTGGRGDHIADVAGKQLAAFPEAIRRRALARAMMAGLRKQAEGSVSAASPN